jgi:hypothetical protein
MLKLETLIKIKVSFCFQAYLRFTKLKLTYFIIWFTECEN